MTDDTTHVRFKKTPSGEVAILPRDEYESLVTKAREADEDAGTSRLVDHARAEVAAGALLLPKEIVDRLASGENPVRVFREWRGMTQMYLAGHKLGIGQSHLSDIETGRRTGTAATLRDIADALGVPLDLLA